MNDSIVVEVRGLAKVFGSGPTRVEALRGVDLVIERGEFVAVMGRSGSGKSTLLHLIAGLDRPSEGTVQVTGKELALLSDDALTCLRRRSVGLVFQMFNLLDTLTAKENVALPLLIDGLAEGEANRRAMEALELVDMEHRASHLPKQMSGGEQQRVAIARALVNRCELLLADEPTGNLDSTTGEQIMRLLRRLVDDREMTIFMVTHDPQHAAIADRVVMLRDGQVASGESEDTESTADVTETQTTPAPILEASS